MAEAAGSEEPVVEQPAAGGQTDQEQDQQTGQAVVDEGKVISHDKLASEQIHSVESQGEVAASSGWGSWGMGGLTSLLSQPHLLEQGLNNVASQVAQVRDFDHYSNVCDGQGCGICGNRGTWFPGTFLLPGTFCV